MKAELYVLTLWLATPENANARKRTRIQFGCANEFLTDAVQYAIAKEVFQSLRMVKFENLPFRDVSELARVGKFMSEVVESK